MPIPSPGSDSPRASRNIIGSTTRLFSRYYIDWRGSPGPYVGKQNDGKERMWDGGADAHMVLESAAFTLSRSVSFCTRDVGLTPSIQSIQSSFHEQYTFANYVSKACCSCFNLQSAGACSQSLSSRTLGETYWFGPFIFSERRLSAYCAISARRWRYIWISWTNEIGLWFAERSACDSNTSGGLCGRFGHIFGSWIQDVSDHMKIPVHETEWEQLEFNAPSEVRLSAFFWNELVEEAKRRSEEMGRPVVTHEQHAKRDSTRHSLPHREFKPPRLLLRLR